MKPYYFLNEDWFSCARQLPVSIIAIALGYDIHLSTIKPCPVCHYLQRGSNDKRAPVVITKEDNRWFCYSCKSSGDSIALLQISFPNKNGESSWSAINSWLGDNISYWKYRDLTDLYCKNSFFNLKYNSDSFIKEHLQPNYPEKTEVLRFWNTLIAPTPSFIASDPQINAFFKYKKYNPEILSQLNILKFSKEQSYLPNWWKPIWLKSMRIITPLYSSNGTFLSIHARSIHPKPKDHPKTVLPIGHLSKNLLMADGYGEQILKDQQIPKLEGILITEGLTDFISSVQKLFMEKMVFATFSVISGSFGIFSKVKWPTNIPFYIATDSDKTGDFYAEKIKNILNGYSLKRINLGIKNG